MLGIGMGILKPYVGNGGLISGLLQETIDYVTRVVNDGGIVPDINSINDDMIFLTDNNLLDKIYHMWTSYGGVKLNETTPNQITTVYDFTVNERDGVSDINNFKQPYYDTSSDIPIIDFETTGSHLKCAYGETLSTGYYKFIVTKDMKGTVTEYISSGLAGAVEGSVAVINSQNLRLRGTILPTFGSNSYKNNSSYFTKFAGASSNAWRNGLKLSILDKDVGSFGIAGTMWGNYNGGVWSAHKQYLIIQFKDGVDVELDIPIISEYFRNKLDLEALEI